MYFENVWGKGACQDLVFLLAPQLGALLIARLGGLGGLVEVGTGFRETR